MQKNIKLFTHGMSWLGLETLEVLNRCVPLPSQTYLYYVMRWSIDNASISPIAKYPFDGCGSACLPPRYESGNGDWVMSPGKSIPADGTCLTKRLKQITSISCSPVVDNIHMLQCFILIGGRSWATFCLQLMQAEFILLFGPSLE